MKRTFVSILLLVLVSMASLAQTNSSAPAAAPANQPPMVNLNGIKVATINMQGAIFGSNEGQHELEILGQKFAPREAELKRLSTEIEDLKKQNTNQGDKMSPEAHEALVKSIETKTKTAQRLYEDYQNEAGQAQNEVMQKITHKLEPVIIKYMVDNSYGLLLDQSSQGAVLVSGSAFDITKAVVDAYNAQSGIAAPAKTGAAARPASTTPSAAKPAATPATTPAKPAGSTTSKPQ